jgi:hypothetical protein
MNRSQLKAAPYNPRILSEAAKRKLRTGLKKHGLVAPLTFNKRTGNMVGGHQRLDQLDALAGTANYELDVAVIDVDEVREKPPAHHRPRYRGDRFRPFRYLQAVRR